MAAWAAFQIGLGGIVSRLGGIQCALGHVHIRLGDHPVVPLEKFFVTGVVPSREFKLRAGLADLRLGLGHMGLRLGKLRLRLADGRPRLGFLRPGLRGVGLRLLQGNLEFHRIKPDQHISRFDRLVVLHADLFHPPVNLWADLMNMSGHISIVRILIVQGVKDKFCEPHARSDQQDRNHQPAQAIALADRRRVAGLKHCAAAAQVLREISF